MSGLTDFRAKHPEYNDMSDPDLAAALHRKFYSDMPIDQFNAKLGITNEPQPGMVEDMAKSGGIGAVKGVIAAPGSFGDAASLNESLASGAAKYLGAPEWAQNLAGKVSRYSLGPLGMLPSTDVIQKAIESQTGKFYEPKTTAGKYAEAVGEFAPSALLGPGSAARKTAMAVVPAVASETAGLLSDNNPYAKTGAAVVGSVLAAGRGGSAAKAMREMAPDMNAVKAQKNALYGALDNAGVKFDANAYDQMLAETSAALKNFRATKAPMTADTVNYMAQYQGQSPTFRDVEDILQEAKGILREKSATDADKAAAGIVVDKLSKFFDGAPLITNGTVSPDEVSSIAKQARDLAKRHIMAKDVAKMQDRAEWYTSGGESGLRNQFASYGRRSGKGMSAMEKNAAQAVLNREGVYSLLNQAGSKLGMLALGSTAAAAGGGIPGGLLAAGVSMGARKVSEKLTQKAVNDYLKTVLAGRQAQNRALLLDKAETRKAITRGLLGSAIGYQSATNN